MILPFLKSIRTLFSYVLAVSFIVSPFIPCGEFIGYAVAIFFLCQLFFIRKFDYALSTWYIIDVLACHCVHQTGPKRTISGWTGQHIHLKRYQAQAKIIDFIFGENHCINEYRKEFIQGYVR